MTVEELIVALGQFDPNMPVRYLDFEQGPIDVETVELSSTRAMQIGVPFDGDEYVAIS